MDIEREIRRRIATGCYKPGQRIPPERELEAEFGCSRITVAKAMTPLVADGLIQRFRGRGTFVVERKDASEALATASSYTSRAITRGNVVKYISPGQDRSGRSSRDDVLAGLHSVLNDAGYHVSVDFYSDLDEHLDSLARVSDPQIAGVALWPTPHAKTSQAVSGILRQGVPLVLVDTYLPSLDCDYVVTDNIEGAATMVHHLAALGHRRICYLTEPADRTSLRDRLAGFLRGMIEMGLPVDSGSVVQLEGPDGEGVEAALQRVVDSEARPTALFMSHDAVAVRAMQWLQSRGVRVPQDLSVVGYDGTEAGEVCAVPLTTIKQNFHEMARVAGRILLERFDGRADPLRYHLMVRPQLIERASCARAML